MWRRANPSDDSAIVEMCLALNAEDPGPRPVPREHVEGTLAAFRKDPLRGMAVVFNAVAYAFLVSFWSNELGGEVCIVDEVYVRPKHRGRGHGTALFECVPRLWSRPYVAIALETTPANVRARAFYERLGFKTRNQTMVRLA